MEPPFKKGKFRFAYHLAQRAHDAVYDPDDLTIDELIGPVTPKLMAKMVKPNKNTILHDIIDYFFDEELSVFDDLDPEDLVWEWLPMLGIYGIECPYADELYELARHEVSDNDKLEKLASKLKKLVVKELKPRIIEETFTLLYGDRPLLLEFGKYAARLVSVLKESDFPGQMERDGKVMRASPNSWLRTAVTYRDKGRCQDCGKDLTVKYRIPSKTHFDHMVSLADGGTNDPTNWQLLCDSCNSGKGKKTFTSDEYQTYW